MRLVKAWKLLRGQAIKAKGAWRVISRSLDHFLKGGFAVKVFTTSFRGKIMGREKIKEKLSRQIAMECITNFFIDYNIQTSPPGVFYPS